MNKREIAEVKKLMKPESACALNKVLVAYVGRDKNVIFKNTLMPLRMSEDELTTYMSYMKNVLTGSIGKNLLELSYDTLSKETENGLMDKVRRSEFEDEDLNEEFINRIAQNYDSDYGYYIVSLSCTYDVPAKKSDDETGVVYQFINTAICPVILQDSILCYNSQKACMEMSSRDVVSVRKPVTGFLYPTFNERTADIHNIMFYTSTPKKPSESFINYVLGCSLELSPEEEKERFDNILSRVLGDDATFTTTAAIHSSINDAIQENTNESVPLELGSAEIKEILKKNGVDEENLEEFDEIYEEEVGDGALTAVNITNESAMRVNTPDITINVKPTATDKVSAKLVDGRRCIVIEMNENVEVNGLDVTVR